MQQEKVSSQIIVKNFDFTADLLILKNCSESSTNLTKEDVILINGCYSYFIST